MCAEDAEPARQAAPAGDFDFGPCDPDLDPVWGLLAGSAAGEALEEALGESGEERARELEAEAEPVVAASDSDSDEAEDAGAGPAPATKKAFSKVVDKPALPASRIFTEEFEEAREPVTCTVIDADAFYLDNVLSVEECEFLIRKTEDSGYQFWDTSGDAAVEFRTAYTLETEAPQFADKVWRRIARLVDAHYGTLRITAEDPKHEVDTEGEWTPVGVNELLLFGRYLDGGHFSPHTDGYVCRDFNERTMLTGILYLNAPRWGGETRIYKDEQIGRPLRSVDGKLTGEPDLVISAVAPKPGRMLFFHHKRMHEGAQASDKYFIRTDLFFRRSPALCTAPEDVEAFQLYQEAQRLADMGDCNGAMPLFRRAFKISPALSKIYGQG